MACCSSIACTRRGIADETGPLDERVAAASAGGTFAVSNEPVHTVCHFSMLDQVPERANDSAVGGAGTLRSTVVFRVGARGAHGVPAGHVRNLMDGRISRCNWRAILV